MVEFINLMKLLVTKGLKGATILPTNGIITFKYGPHLFPMETILPYIFWMRCHAPNMFGTMDIGIISPAFRKLKSFFKNIFIGLKHLEEDCGCHPTRRLLQI